MFILLTRNDPSIRIYVALLRSASRGAPSRFCKMLASTQHVLLRGIFGGVRISKTKIVRCRQNNIDKAGWNKVMDGLTVVTSINTMNDVEGLGELFAGKVEDVILSGMGLLEREAIVPVSRLLLRSVSTLTRLDLR